MSSIATVIVAVLIVSYITSSEVLLPVFVTVTLTVTFCPALIVVGMIFRPEYLKVVYELQIN